MRLLPVGLDLNEFPFHERNLSPGEPVNLITVARLTEIKGYATILRSIVFLIKSGIRARYDIVGDGPLRKDLETLAAQLRLSDTVIFQGALRADQIARF